MRTEQDTGVKTQQTLVSHVHSHLLKQTRRKRKYTVTSMYINLIKQEFGSIYNTTIIVRHLICLVLVTVLAPRRQHLPVAVVVLAPL